MEAEQKAAEGRELLTEPPYDLAQGVALTREAARPLSQWIRWRL